MNRWLDCIKNWYACSLGISDDLIKFRDESIKNKMAAAAIYKKIDMVIVEVILTDQFCLFFTDMTYVPGQFIPYIFLAPSHKWPFSKMAA